MSGAPYHGQVAANRLGEFLRARREAAPAQNGSAHQRRRTPGLRREEVAARAAVSTDYYTRLEQGRERHPSPQVLDALAVALELSSAEAGYLRGLVAPPGTPRTLADTVPNEFLRLVARSWELGPAYVVNHRGDILVSNRHAQQILEYFEISDNMLRMLFLDPLARRMWGDWEAFARFLVGGIRRNIGPDLDNYPDTAAMIAEMSERSEEFSRLWNSHEIDVREHKQKLFRHSDFGEIRLDFELLTAIDSPGQLLVLHRTSPEGLGAEQI